MPNSQTIAQVHHEPSTPTPDLGEDRLSLWLKKLPHTAIPIHQHTAKDIIQLLGDDNCNSTKLSQLIKQDPMLCLKLYHNTQEALHNKEGGIQHLIHLLGLIGLNQVEDTVTQSTQRSNNPTGLQELLSASLFSAQLSSGLLMNKHTGYHDRFYLATLLFNAPLWLMWLAAPKTLSQGQQLASRHQHSYIQLSTKKLGFYLPDLLNKTNDFIHLPDMALKALTINPQADLSFWAKAHHLSDAKLARWFSTDKEAKCAFYSPEMGVYLLNHYVLALYLDWGGKYIQRYSHLLSRHLGLEPLELQEQVAQAASEMKLPKHFNHLLAPTARLQGLHKEISTSTPAREGIAPAPLDNWLQHIQDSNSTEQALKHMQEALSQGLDVEHCVILHVGATHIRTHTCYGFSRDANIHSFEYNRHAKQQLFHQLIQQPACISLANEDIPKAIGRIPLAFQECCAIQPCALLSVFHQGHPEVIIYCDHPVWDTPKHQAFKRLGKQLNKTLQSL